MVLRADVSLHQVADLGIGADTLAFSRDGHLLAVGSPDHEVQVWDTTIWRQLWMGVHGDHIRKVAFSPDSQRLASVSFDHTARLWHVTTGDQIARLDYGYWVYGLDFSADSQRWATGSFDGKALIADATTGQVLSEFEHELMVADLALSPNAPWLAVMISGSWGPGKVVVWDIFTHARRDLAEFSRPSRTDYGIIHVAFRLFAGLRSVTDRSVKP